jgi:phosphinothricin acetyltransferase
MTLSHRIAQPSDLPQIVEIYNSTVASRMVTADLEPVSVESKRAWFEQHAPRVRPLWVVDHGSQIAGWLSLSDFYGRPAYSRTAEVSVYVRDTSRRAGIGAYLLSQATAHAPALGIDTLIGFIFGHNEPSLSLFRRFGFSIWGELPRVTVLDGIERDVIIVGRRLAP